MNSRDDFSEPVKRSVAMRAGWLCSLCQKLTVGPSEEKPDQFAKIGEAAHITAAASGPGARRYDSSMSAKERASIGNAIWLCADHARLIDRDEATYTVEKLHSIKKEHERAVSLSIQSGASAQLSTGLVAIGPQIVCTGELTAIGRGSWTLRLAHFLTGDMHGVVNLIDRFDNLKPGERYVLSNELGDGRLLQAAPTLTKEAGGFSLVCPVASGFPRVAAQSLGGDLALHPDTGDLYIDEKGSIARISGTAYLPQKFQTTLSLSQNESPFHPTFGARLFEYFDLFRGSTWLDLLFKLDVVRQACIPYHDKVMGRQYTPLQCVNRVRNVELLADSPTKNRLPVRLSLDVQGVGEWSQILQIYIPTAEQMTTRAKMLAEMPWINLDDS